MRERAKKGPNQLSGTENQEVKFRCDENREGSSIVPSCCSPFTRQARCIDEHPVTYASQELSVPRTFHRFPSTADVFLSVTPPSDAAPQHLIEYSQSTGRTGSSRLPSCPILR
jgi:hypothetical protein